MRLFVLHVGEVGFPRWCDGGFLNRVPAWWQSNVSQRAGIFRVKVLFHCDHGASTSGSRLGVLDRPGLFSAEADGDSQVKDCQERGRVMALAPLRRKDLRLELVERFIVLLGC